MDDVIKTILIAGLITLFGVLVFLHGLESETQTENSVRSENYRHANQNGQSN